MEYCVEIRKKLPFKINQETLINLNKNNKFVFYDDFNNW